MPLLTSHACALPGIMSARLIPDRRDRLATIIVAPFMSCSARLPVYVLLTSLLFAGKPGWAGLAFAGCYLLGGTAALLSALLFGRTVLKGRARPMVLELPSYKVPSLTNALVTAKDQGLAVPADGRHGHHGHLRRHVVAQRVSEGGCAGSGAGRFGSRQAVRAQPEARAAELNAEADTSTARAVQAGSFAGRIGRTIQPVFAPLGYDWQLTVGVLTSFLAREVFVSTMSVLVGGAGDAEVDDGVIDRIRAMTPGRWCAGVYAGNSGQRSRILRAGDAVPAYAGCHAQGDRHPQVRGLQLAYMSGLAYVSALIVYQALRAAGLQ